MSCFPAESRPLIVLDRGYARVALLQKLLRAGIPFLVRSKKNVVVYFQGQPRALSRFSFQPGQIQRYTVYYHSRAKEPLDLIIFRGLGYKETWYLLVPKAFSRDEKEIVDLYAKRMSIEQGFRDWKTHLGVRGLVFRVSDPAPHLTRLLLAFSLAYLICLALGATEEAQQVRAFVEIPRRKPRHQTTRTLSALSIGILRLSLPRFAPKSPESPLKRPPNKPKILCAISLDTQLPPQYTHTTQKRVLINQSAIGDIPMKKLLMFMAFFAFVAIMLGGIPKICDSQEVFPTRPVQIIVTFPPGGVADTVARSLANSLEKIFKQPVLVINKVGAGGAVGTQSAAIAKPDGYTLMVALSTITVLPEVDTLFGRPRLYELDDFVPIALLTRDPLIFVVRKDAPWKTLQEFVDEAKKRPNEIKFASGGMYTPPHLGAELFANKIGTKFRHIAMAGGAPALNAILGGHVETTLASLWGYSHIKSGDLRPLGCMGEKRNPVFPNIPTFKEQGFDVEFYMWSGFFARKATPPAIINILREATKKAVNSIQFNTAMTKLDNPPTYLDAPEFKKFIEIDSMKSIEVVRIIGKVQ